MQLKTIGESITALNSITTVLNTTTAGTEAQQIALMGIGEKYNLTILKQAISQTKLNKAQIENILTGSTIKGNLISTTATELAQVTSTNALAASQKTATGTTIGFGNAMKGLGASIKALAVAHPILLSIAGALAISAGLAVSTDAFQKRVDGTTAVNKYNKELEESEQKIENNTSALSEYQSEIEANKSKIEELQALSDNGTITETQETELNNLKYQNALLDEKIKKLEEVNKEEVKSQAINAEKKFNTQFNDGSDDTQSTNAKDVISRVSQNLGGDGTSNGIGWVRAIGGIDNDTAVEQLAKLKLATDAYNQTIADFNNGVNDVTQEDVENIQSVLEKITQSFDKNQETLYNSLTSEMEKMKAAENTDAYNQYAYESMQSWLEIFQQYVPEYKEAMEKVQRESASNPIEQSITYSTDFTSLNEGLSNISENASLLSTINKEISETGQISADNLAKINEAFPEKKYSEMTKALYKYQLGLINEKELFAELEKCYSKDKDNHITNLKKKAETDENFWSTLYKNSTNIQSVLIKVYGADYKAFGTVAEAKKKLLDNLSDKYAAFMKLVVKGSNGLYTMYDQEELKAEVEGLDEGGSVYANSLYAKTESLYNSDKINEFKAELDKYNNAVKAIDDEINNHFRDPLNWQDLSDFDTSSSSSDTAKSYDLIERAVENLRRKMTSLKNTTDDTFASWSDRNQALINQIQTTTEQIQLQQKAYDKYMQLANSTGLSNYYKGLIQNGAIDEIPVSDKVTQEQIDSYKDYYDKAISASEAVDELKSSLNELEKSKMDIISNEINKVKEQLTSAINLIDGYIELAETSGLFASEDSYKQLIEYYQKYLSNLYNERDALDNQLKASVASDIIKEDTEEWYNMQSQINEVNEAILDTIVNIKDMSNQLMNLNFEKFEYMQGKIENLTSEADFYLNLIESMDKELYNENGSFTSEGITATGLHAQNLNTYLQQADDYAKKLAEIEKEIANDPLNNNLTDKKQEYIEAQREAVLSAQDERNAIADLVKDGYDKQLDSLSDLISKYKDLMSAQKDAYDYEKQMSEKAENLASLKKQYEAWKGNTSEEGMKVRQELEVQIKDAQEDIQESEYDKLISDTEKLLDNLQDEYEALINERIDNINSELQNITSSVNESASIIVGVLEELSNDTGLPLTDAMLNIWNDAQPVADINSSVENVNDTLSGTNEAIQGLRDDVKNILSQMEKEIEDTKAKIDNGSSNNANNTGNNRNSGSNNSSGSTPLSPANGSNSSNGSATSNNNANAPHNSDWSIYKHYYPQKLNTDTSVVDRLKSNNIDASFEARSQYWDKLIGEGTYKSTYDQNVKLLNWLKNNGYANGTKSASKGWHLFDENGLGSEVLLTKQGVLKQFEGGEHVFDAQATKNLWKLAQSNPAMLMPDIKLNTTLPEMIGKNVANNIRYSCGDVSFVLPNVKNYEDIMKQAQNDRRFEKMVQEMTLGETFGHNSFKKLQY